MKFIILTIFTEGAPHDHGANLVSIEQEFKNAVKDHADKYIAITPGELVAMDPAYDKYCGDYTSWLERHPDRNQLGRHNPGWAKVGFLMWKPQVIKRLLNSDEIEMGDIVLYHDVNCRAYPNYILNCEQWRGLSASILDELKCDFFMSSGYSLKTDVKACLVRKYLGEEYFEKAGLWAGLIVMRKSPMALQFVSEWADMSSQLENVSPLPNPNPHPEFIWNSIEQSTAGVLAWKWRLEGRLAMDWPRYKIRERRFAKEYLTKVDLKGRPYRSPFRRVLSKLRNLLEKTTVWSVG